MRQPLLGGLLAVLVYAVAGAACSDDDACSTNADCENSSAADDLKGVRCAGQELYCLNRKCRSGCMAPCSVVRTDVNPCPEPRLCTPKLDGSVSFCTITPTTCESADDCSSFLPPTSSAETAQWSCEEGLCVYPGYEYPTR